MGDISNDPVEQLGLHVLLTAMALRLLRGEQLAGNPQLDQVVAYLRKQPPRTLNVLQHEEPLYVAGDIVGLSTAEIDALPAGTWEEYHLRYRQMTEATRSRRREVLKTIWPRLTTLVRRGNEATGDYELQIVRPDDGPPDGTEPAAEAASGRRL